MTYTRKEVIGNATLYLGDCMEILRAIPDNSVDSIVTDPPYGLSFMGKKWDYDVPSVDIWAECLRVLKPGGHLLAFAGTRTQHRMAVRIEDAGFEIRDMIAWVYGSGFPKSLDVSKAIDKHGPSGQVPFGEFAAHYEARRKACGLTHAQVCAAGGWHGATNHGGTSANWANGYGMPTVEQWAVLQPLLGLGDEWSVRVEREQYEREVIGKRSVNRGVAFTSDGPDEIPITAPGSDAARQWQGWGTALKPALEPITLARKPLIGTVAANVLAHGTGGLNIDGCRIAGEPWKAHSATGLGSVKVFSEGDTPVIDKSPHDAGRWPANLIHDGSGEVMAGFPTTTSGKPGDSIRTAKGMVLQGGGGGTPLTGYGDTGSAARFFYCAKASKKDRDEGLDHMEAIHRVNGNKWTDQDYRVARGERPPSAESGPRKNTHPTVKPTDLMAYLCRLVTPVGGVVLDSFMGSGSTGKAAVQEGFRFIGCEREIEYFDIACRRIEQAVAQGQLFAPGAAPQPQQLGLEDINA